MRHYIFLSIFSLCLFVGQVNAQEASPPQASTESPSMQDKLERTRMLMREAQDPSKKAAADSEKKIHDDELSISGIKMIQSLGFLVALVLAGAWMYRKFVLKEDVLPVRQMKLLERLPLSPRSSLFLAEVRGMKIVVGLTADSISLLPLDKNSDFTVTLEKEYEENN